MVSRITKAYGMPDRIEETKKIKLLLKMYIHSKDTKVFDSNGFITHNKQKTVAILFHNIKTAP
ncbi:MULTISPECIES: hypothetical protein [unclassified Peribacillus]|uniref:hypothetical protein n=1 Tax=unclassified Peribacillus TaxID=2675266 RepID=UPI0019133DAC|nr:MULTISPECIES: hypothetical protein [unclassified Peribacillus]MBK5482198.1 hypothetical protein [Peribacillus sp. TH16]MBK5498574.1 hypothetical protein [Peribacillus sp. TH14]